MTTVAEAFVTLRPDTKDFEKEAKSGISDQLTKIAKVSAVAFGAAGVAAVAFGVKAAASFQQTTIAFEGILGDAGKAKDLLGDLRDFAAKTPFEFAGLAESARSLLAVGFSAKDIIPTMTTLGNVAATLGVGEAEIKGVVRALGQMKGKGKASAEELQQISEQIPGFSAIKVIAEDMGITVAEAFKKMEKGAIPADAAIDSILRGMEKFPGASGAMERQSKTLNGVISTLKDTVTNMAIDFITPYLPAISAAVQTFSGWLTKTVVPALQSFVDIIAKEVVPKLLSISSWIIDHKPILEGLAVAVGTLLTTAFIVWGASIIAATWPLIVIGAAIAAVTAGVIYAYENWGWFRDAVDTVASFMRDTLWPILKDVGGWIKDTLVPIVQDAASWFVDHLKPALKAVGDYIVDHLKPAFKDIGDYFENTLIPKVKDLKEKWDETFPAMKTAVEVAWKVIKPILEAMKENLKGVADALDRVVDVTSKVPVAGFLSGLNAVLPGASSIFGRAAGGPVLAGHSYQVNERGREVFTPATNGSITSNDDLTGLLGAILGEIRSQKETMVRLART